MRLPQRIVPAEKFPAGNAVIQGDDTDTAGIVQKGENIFTAEREQIFFGILKNLIQIFEIAFGKSLSLYAYSIMSFL